MTACRSCCSAVVLLVASALGTWEAFLQWELRAATLERPPTHLPEPLTFDGASLSHEQFVREFVQRREPVKVRLADADVDVWNASWMLEHCGDTKLDLMSKATKTVLEDLPWPAWFTKAVELVFTVLLRRWTSLQAELDHHMDVKLSDYAAEMAQPVPGGPAGFSLGLPLVMQRMFPPELLAFMEVFARPRYLSDQLVANVCPEALHSFRVPKLLLPNWAHLAAGRVVPQPSLFWGKAQSQSYPLHRDKWDGAYDFAMIMLRGKKRYALFRPEEGRHLARIPAIANAEVFQANPFVPDVVATPGLRDVAGWKGEVSAGEILYVPTGLIHQFENYDFEEATVALKWSYLGHEHVEACRGLSDDSEAACAEALGVGAPGPSERGPTAIQAAAEQQELLARLG